MNVTTELQINPDAVTRGVIPYIQVEGAAAAVDLRWGVDQPAEGQ